MPKKNELHADISAGRKIAGWESKAIILIFVVGLLLRVWNVLEFQAHDPMFAWAPLGVDMHHFQKWITNIVRTNWVDREYTPFWQAPLYPYVMAFVMTIFGKSMFWLKLFQALLGSVDLVLMYLIGKKVFSVRVGIIAAFIGCFYGIAILYDVVLLRDGMLTFLYLLTILSLLQAQEKGNIGYYLLAGICFGLAIIGRPNVAPFALPALLWLWFASGRIRSRRKAALAGAYLLGTFLAITPVTLKNYFGSGEFILINKQGGLIFYIGNCYDATGTLTLTNSMMKIAPDFVHMSFEDVAKFDWTGMALAQIRENPFRFMRLMFKKLYLFWASYEIPNNVNYYLSKNFSWVLRLPLIPFWLLLPPAITGMILSMKQWWPKAALLVLFILTYMGSIIILFVVARYRISITPFLMIFAGYTFSWWYDNWKGKNYKPIALSFVPLLLVGAFSLATRSDYVRTNDYFNLALAYNHEGKHDEAISNYKKALLQDPSFSPARRNLIAEFLALDRSDDALQTAYEGIAIDPANPDYYYSLASVLLEVGRFDEATKNFEHVLVLEPNNAGAHGRLADLYERQGRTSAARREREKAAAIAGAISGAN
jgi:4-amino-4-deoxy-L-arabinose transferase-like glycosyltransferase